MRRPLLLLHIAIAALLTAGCTVTFPAERVASDEPSIGVVRQDERSLNPYLGLRAYPGSRIVERSIDGRDSETTFEANASLQAVYRHFHEQLAADGWRRVSFEVESDEIEATYVRDGRELELELDRDDGRFELELDVD